MFHPKCRLLLLEICTLIFTGIVMVLRDKCKKEYKVVKICFDIVCILIGFILGGKIGIITILTAATAGPVIQLFADCIKKQLKR